MITEDFDEGDECECGGEFEYATLTEYFADLLTCSKCGKQEFAQGNY
jgi:hypothetical protein